MFNFDFHPVNAQNEEIIRSQAIPDFWVKRSWLDRRLRANPTVAEALADFVA
jgi:hypothetical protein